MKKSKKIISIILAILLIASIGTVMLISNAEDNSRNTTITVNVDEAELKAGESATVTVKATTNYAVGTMSIPIFYNKTLVEVDDSTTPLNYDNKAVTTDLTAVDTKKIYANTGVDSNKFGFVLINYIAGAGDTVETMLTDAVVATFSITAKADVRGEAAIKVVSESAKTDKNAEGMLYFGAQPDGNKINAIPENVEGIDVESASANVLIFNDNFELKANDGTTGFVDEDNKYIYGVAAGTEDFSEYFAVENGSFEMVANEAGYTNGTGAMLNILNASGTVVDTYTLIIFGDVNGDGAITAADGNTIKSVALGGSIDEGAMAFAADVNGDGSITAADGNTVKSAALGGEISVNPYA